MIQGATLGAGLADCGDVLDAVGPAEAMTSYVILSRLTSASGLLLLRAFSPELFNQGPPPGPSCLLDHLRHRFAGGVSTHTLQDAQQEYNALTKAQDVGREKRKQRGPAWQCWHCGNKSLAEGFGAEPKNQNEVYDKCVAPGHWRSCIACSRALLEYQVGPRT